MNALVFTMRDLAQRASHVISEVERTGLPAFITRHGRFIAVITPLATGEVESRVLTAIAREINGQEDPGNQDAAGPPPRRLRATTGGEG